MRCTLRHHGVQRVCEHVDPVGKSISESTTIRSFKEAVFFFARVGMLYQPPALELYCKPFGD